jgi:hypothetical protein
MSIEKAAQNVEHEAMRNPQEAAASIKLLDAAQQDKILNQIQRDAQQKDANFSVERNQKGEVTGINFTPLFNESTTLGHANSTNRR